MKMLHGSGERLRLDELLVARGLASSRSRARDAIQRATVKVGGIVSTKPGVLVDGVAAVEIDDPGRFYVSRAALKLVEGLDHFGFDPTAAITLDIGASTGGFTQVLLERGAEKVFAIDVGHRQLHEQLRSDPRVVVREGLNARDLSPNDLNGEAPQIIVCDVSFISLKLALPPALALAENGAQAVVLVKPQFEAGREAIGKGGLLRNRDDGLRIASELSSWMESQAGWRSLGTCPSPIEGGDGNKEFLLGAVKHR